MSEYKAEVFRVGNIENHPGADRLEIIKFAGYQTCVQKGTYKSGDLAVFLPPETICSVTRPEFSFLADKAKSDGKARIRAIKLRGVHSFGLLIPAPNGMTEGQDAWEALGLEHYEPPIAGEAGNKKEGLFLGSGEIAKTPSLPFQVGKYDIENLRSYPNVFEKGEAVSVLEKIEGESSAYVYWDGEFHCKSRNNWKREYPSYDHVTVEGLVEREVDSAEAEQIVAKLKDKAKPQSKWWFVLRTNEELQKFLRDNPGVVVFGEIFGHVGGGFHYGKNGKVSFAAFDVMQEGKWVDHRASLDLLQAANVPTAPILAKHFPFDFVEVCELAEGNTTCLGASHVREGCVVTPVIERWHPKLGRVKLKAKGCGYLSRGK